MNEICLKKTWPKGSSSHLLNQLTVFNVCHGCLINTGASEKRLSRRRELDPFIELAMHAAAPASHRSEGYVIIGCMNL